MGNKKALGLYTEKDINFSRAIEACMKRSGKTAKELACKAHICLRSHYNRLERPGEMTVNELRVYIREARIPAEDILDALYLDKK